MKQAKMTEDKKKELVHAIWISILETKHRITETEVIFEFNPKLPGKNAAIQMQKKIEAAINQRFSE